MISQTLNTVNQISDVTDGFDILQRRGGHSLDRVAALLLRPNEAATTFTLKLQASADGENWVEIDEFTNADDAATLIRVAVGLRYRFQLTAVSANDSVTVTLTG